MIPTPEATEVGAAALDVAGGKPAYVVKKCSEPDGHTGGSPAQQSEEGGYDMTPTVWGNLKRGDFMVFKEVSDDLSKAMLYAVRERDKDRISGRKKKYRTNWERQSTSMFLVLMLSLPTKRILRKQRHVNRKNMEVMLISPKVAKRLIMLDSWEGCEAPRY